MLKETGHKLLKGFSYTLILSVIIIGAHMGGVEKGRRSEQLVHNLKKDSVLIRLSDSLSVTKKKIDELEKHIIFMSRQNERHLHDLDSINIIIRKLPKKLPR